ncbi:MAG: ATP-binding protein [Micrococcales bacterium]|nr:ATP-binding protein [Micrococcales bacterium]
MGDEWVERWASRLLAEAMSDTRVVFVMGARQVGKSALISRYADEHGLASVVTLDTKAARDAAVDDPTGFVAELPRPAVIDEVQRAPDVLLAIKEAVDKDSTPGQFLLTGSANVRTNRRVKDALTGRMEIITLWPLARGELARSTNLVDALFLGQPPVVTASVGGREAFVSRVTSGGFPEAMAREGRRRARWFNNYVETTLDRDLRDLSDALKLDQMPRLLRLAATQTAGLVNYANLADRLRLSEATVRSYLELLETVFLVRRLPAWRPGLANREVHSPKLHLVDTGLLLSLLGADADRLATDQQITGKALENYVVMEVTKQLEAALTVARAYHYRAGRYEVDLVLEAANGDVVGIEVKASATPSSSDRRGLEKLRDLTGPRFKAGAVIYSGRQTLPLGDRLWALPICALG